MRAKIFSPQVIFTICLMLLFLLCVYPFGVLGQKILFINNKLSFEYFSKLFESQTSIVALKNTLLVSLLTGFFSTFLALPLSWLLMRTNLPFSKNLKTFFCLPYAIPPYIGAMAWIYLANPTTGILNQLVGQSFFNIYSLSGLIWVMSSFFFTLVLLNLVMALENMDPSLEEAARVSGASGLRVFFQITFPLIFPSLLSGILLVVMATAASFGVPAMIGSPAGIYLLTTRIYMLQKMGSISGIYQAGALSMVLLALAFLSLIINHYLLKKNSHQIIAGKSPRPSLVDLGRWKWPLFVSLVFVLVVIFILPLGAIAITAFSKVQGKLAWDNLGFQNILRVFLEMEETPRAFFNSFKWAILGASIATMLGLLLSYIIQKTKAKGTIWIGIFASLPYATPGTVLALAFILAFSGNIFGLPFSLYNTFWPILMVYIAKYLNFSIRTTSDGLGQIHDSLAEASKISGASWIQTMRYIWFPLMRPALVASWFLVFMPAFSELTMTILLTGPGLESLGTLIFQLQEYADASGGGAAVLALVTVILVIMINSVVKTLSKGRYGL